MAFGKLGSMGKGFGKQGSVLQGASSPPSDLASLDFVSGTYAGGALSDMLSCSRSSVGYAQGANGILTQFATNTPRITDLGLLVEESRTNFILQSMNFASASWSLFGVTKIGPAPVNDPAGGSTAYEIQFGAGGGAIGGAAAMFQGFSGAASTTYAVSVYAQAKTAPTSVRASFSDQAGVVTGSADIPISVGVWTRIPWVATNTNAGAVNMALRNNVAGNSGNVYVAFAQAEVGAFLTSYIPTTTGAVTRQVDNLSLLGAALAAGIAPSGWATVDTGPGAYTASAFLLGGSGASDYYVRQGSGGATTINGRLGGAGLATATIGGGGALGTSIVKSGITWDANNLTIVGNNGTPVSVAQALSLPVGLSLGSRGGSNASSLLFRKLVLGSGYIPAGVGAKTA